MPGVSALITNLIASRSAEKIGLNVGGIRPMSMKSTKWRPQANDSINALSIELVATAWVDYVSCDAVRCPSGK